MKRVRATTVLLTLIALAATPALGSGLAWGSAERHPQVGRLPGYPSLRGVVPALASKQALGKRETLLDGALAAARARLAGKQGAEAGEALVAPCVEEAFGRVEAGYYTTTQDVCYRGGPVLHDPEIHLIFWQGPLEKGAPPPASHVGLFPAHYEEIVSRYFEGLAHDNATPSGVLANSLAVQPQYSEENSKGEPVPGDAAIRFSAAGDVTVDDSAFPSRSASECSDLSKYSEGPCLLDADIQKEAEKIAGTSTKGLGDVYVVLTPPGVGGCFEQGSGECSYSTYCAYHGDFGGEGVTTSRDQTLYVDLPYLGEVAGCDSGVHPNEAFSPIEEEEALTLGLLLDEGADAAIDTVSHEVNETISDPIGSQCKAKATTYSECERNAWTDVIGQEIGDKCLPPESTLFGVYGGSLGEAAPEKPLRSFNQQIDGHDFYAQRIWSNGAGLAEGGCVQRGIQASFTVSAGAQATVPMTLDGSASGAPGDPAVYWVWSIRGTGEQFGSEQPTLSHTFAQPGEYVVGLTAYDRYGNAQATKGKFTVGQAPLSSPPPGPLGAPTSIILVVKEVVKETVAPNRLTAAQLAARLGLPASGKKLAGSGPFALGHGECPPACGVTLQLSATVATVSHNKRHTSRLATIGSAHLTFAAKGTGALSLSLNAKGRALLRRGKSLACKLIVTVEGQEGGTWQIVRTLTIGTAAAARRARR